MTRPIVLLRPPIVFSRSSFSVPVTMPLAIAYLAGSLRQAGHAVCAIDAVGEALDHIGTSYSPKVVYRGLSNQQIIARIPGDARAIGVSTMFSQEWPHIEDLINEIHVAFPHTPIIVGGEHATACSEYILQSCPAVQYVALGEGENTILEFAEFLDGQRAIEDVAGIHYRSADGQIHQNPRRDRERAPDQFPWPAWDLFNLTPYFDAGEGHGVERGRSMPILATRGCPYQCTFCSSPTMWTTRYVMREVPQVVDEIAHYVEHYHATNIDFYDLTAIIKRDWILAFCSELKRRGLAVTWQLPSGTRSEAMDDDVLEAMATSGCMNVTYAPESGSEPTLQRIKKKVKLPRLFDSIRGAKRHGIFVKTNLVLGFPQDTRMDVYRSLRTSARFAWMGVDDAPLYAYSPYPGSELYAYLRGTGAISEMNRAYFESLMTFMDLTTTS
ncbi:MAG: B12-binding domain-containing radical SAM protein, partial [Acidobacteria bacterium]|nr:B12-binding domain-containing radical SAM protein [Acidobacteriota bacterium]